MSGLAEEKVRAREQWTQDPCGAVHGEHEFGTREFFDTVERHRYTEYGPWMPQLMGFDKFRGARLLEIGCGMGTDLLQFARGGACCTGIDLTPRSIEITRHRFRLYDADGAFMISDGEHLPFRDESFDVVYSNGVLHHTPRGPSRAAAGWNSEGDALPSQFVELLGRYCVATRGGAR
jgi:SAM-dependent methyltransferase